MLLTIVGCSGSFAGPESAASCYLVQTEHEGRTFSMAVDLGNGSLGSLQRHLDPTDLDAVLLTHLHVDHCIDMCGLYVMQKYHPGKAPCPPIDVWAPRAAPDYLARAYGDISAAGMTNEFTFHGVADRQPLTIGPFRVTPRRVHHPIEAYGYRIEADGAVLVLTGDTDSCDALPELMAGADLVLADSAFVDGRDTLTGIHMNGRQCAEAAVAAGGVRRLMLTHIPAWNDPQVCRSQAAAVWPGEVELARAGDTHRLP